MRYDYIRVVLTYAFFAERVRTKIYFWKHTNIPKRIRLTLTKLLEVIHQRIGKRPRSSAFEGVPIRALCENLLRSSVDMIRHCNEHWMTGRARKRPIQHLSSPHKMSRVRLRISEELILPPNNQCVFCVNKII